MIGRRPLSPVTAAACVAFAYMASACSPDGATTGPSHVTGKDFAANLRTISGDQQIGPLGAALGLPVVVKVVDAGGQPVAGATVTFSVRAGGGSINPAANVSDANGLVSSSWTMGAALGAAKVVAMLTNNFVLDSATFTATATVAAPKTLSKVSGDSQTLNASRKLLAPLVVSIIDAYGNNLSGVRVTWTTGNLSGTVAAVSDTSAADGKASANWTLGNVATGQSVTATVAGLTSIGFTATAIPDTGRIITPVGAVNKGTLPATSNAPTLSVTVTDQYVNPIVGASVIWNDSLVGGAFVGGGSVSFVASNTAATGTATTTWTLGRRAGAQVVRARLAGRTETVQFTASASVPLSDVNAGNFSSCGLATDGTAMCWGYGADGQLGKLTNTKNTNSISTSVSPTDSLLGPFLTFRSLNVGKNHACGVTIGRDLYCWGANNILQIGPVAAGGVPGKWKGDQVWGSVSAGEFNTCALTPTGVLYCSGSNDQGQMGNGAASAAGAAPALAAASALPVAPATTSLYSAVAVGQSHVCAMPRYNAAAPILSRVPFCWGFNTSGQTGDGLAASPKLMPTQISTALPLPANTVFDSTTLVAGNTHTCAVGGVGVPTVTYCWGGNGFGQLGDGTLVNRSVPTAVTLAAGVSFVQLSAGAFHTCGLTVGGVAYCWGRNSSGQLGDGTTTPPPTNAPVQVNTSVTFRSITAGELFTCGVAGVPGPSGGTISTAADVYCWGDNEYGQIGNINQSQQNNTPRLTPVKISFIP